MARIRTDWLETFLAAVETGSFTAAAERVHRSQSAVSLQVAQLEQSLGRQLLERGRRGLHPTAAGERLLPYVRRAADAVEAVRHVLSADAPQPLRLGIPDEYADGALPELAARFSRAHPNVALAVVCAPSRTLETRVNSGALDIAVALRDEITGAGQTLADDPTCWVTSAHAPRRLNDGPLPVAVFDHECSWRRWALDGLERAGIDYRVVYTSASVPALRAAIRSGIAVGLLGASTLTDDVRRFQPLDTRMKMPASTLVELGNPAGRTAPAATLSKLIADALDRSTYTG